jgi:ANTAR domain
VELANHQLEVGQLRQALSSRVWIEQAKGMVVAATQGVTLDQAFHQLRGRARSSSRKLADVVQDVQRERVAAKALDDARVRAAEARAREVEQALKAPRPGWPGAPPPWTGPKMSSPRANAPPTTPSSLGC